MKRKNPGLSSLPDAPIDLTPLLDVIFIFLFVVLIGYTARVQAVEAEATDRNKQLEEEVRNLNAQLEDEKTLLKSYEERLAGYEDDIIGGRVMIVTIHCTWDEEDSRKRQIRILTSDREYDPISLTAENQENGYARLDQILGEYAADHPDSVIVISLNTEKILRRDRLAINELMDKLKRKYSYVY